MEKVKVLFKATSGVEYFDNIGWLDGETKDISILQNLHTKMIVETKKVKPSYKIIETAGDFALVEFNNGVEYVVKPLDTLQQIAKKFDVKKEDIIKINNLKSEKLFIGQILKL